MTTSAAPRRDRRDRPRRSVIDNLAHGYTRRGLAAVSVPEPGARRGRRSSDRAEEVTSPVHPAGYLPRRRRYRQVEPDHLVIEAQWARKPITDPDRFGQRDSVWASLWRSGTPSPRVPVPAGGRAPRKTPYLQIL